MIKVMARAAKRAEILIHEEIGADWFGEGLTSKKFAEDLKKIGDVDTLVIRINSPGGAVFDALGIFNALKDHPARKEVVVEGLAASSASFIAMVGDTIRMGEGAMMMVHNPWTLAMGDANDMRKAADTLDEIAQALIDIYQKRTKLPRDDLKALLDAETWMRGDDAVAKGFADEAVTVQDEEAEKAAALLATDYRDRYAAFAKEFRQPADANLMRIAASAIKAKPAVSHEEDTPMTPEEILAAKRAEAAAQEAARAATLQAEQTRRAAIRTTFGKFSGEHRELLDSCLDDSNCTADAASNKLLAKLGEGHTPSGGGSVVAGPDAKDKFLAGASNAILARAGLAKKEAGNEFNGMSLAGLAAHALTMKGISVKGMSSDQIARKVLASLSTSDFPTLINTTANKTLLAAYQAQPSTWQLWAKKGTVTDFKVNTRLAMGSFGNLLTIPEGSEYKQGTLGSEYNTLQALTKGRYIQVTRQLIVNDDLGAFTDQADYLGKAARRTVEADAYSGTNGIVTNPTMADTGTLFNATAVTTAGGHANYTSSGTAITAASLNVGKQVFWAQKDASLNDFMQVEPRYLLVSPAKEMEAWTLLNSTADITGSNAAKRNWAQTMNLTVIVSPYLTGNTWYLLGDKDVAPSYEVAFLNGEDTPYTDEEVEFLTDAMRMKVRLDYGVAPINWRSAYKNAGA